MGQGLGQGDFALARLSEFRPDLCDRRVIIEPLLINEPGQTNAVIALPVEKTGTIVSAVQGCSPLRSE